MPLHVFEHYVLIIRRSKLYYTASGIITPVCGLPVHRMRESSLNLCTGRHLVSSHLHVAVRCTSLRESSLNLCTGRPHTGVMIPDAV